MNCTPRTLQFTDISLDEFLKDYWQKKPVVLKQAMPDFINQLSPEELGGLSLEPEIESRIVIENPGQTPAWQLLNGPFDNDTYTSLPESHWTLLVQGVDRLLPEIQQLLDYFDFIPQWRVDDVMISYAARYGNVGPHYDNYDVFLLQAQGQRNWTLTTQHCNEQNYLGDVALRVMDKFIVEQEYILEPGDILYLPPHVGHHGVSLTDDCMTYSFGYRSYKGDELLNSFCDYVHEQGAFKSLYKDPDWRNINHTSELPDSAWKNAKSLLQNALADDTTIQNWFGQFATSLDSEAETQLPLILEDVDEDDLITLLNSNETLQRHPSCKMVYQLGTDIKLYINGVAWQIDSVSIELIKLIANQRTIECSDLLVFLDNEPDKLFVFELWQLQWIQFQEEYE
jgi:50S ribosomal protein L16 3-hydroxylase